MQELGNAVSSMNAGELYYVYYCGPATVRKEDEKEEAGLWSCTGGETISIEEVLQTIYNNAYGRCRMVSILSDCPGAAGAYHRLIKKLCEGWSISDRINRIKMDFACDYNEVPFAGERGGLWSTNAIAA